MIGQLIGKYRIIAKIGEGGMGAVYEAVDERMGKHVAIKVLHKDHAQNPQVTSRFINEARAINVVHHPGVVQVTEYDTLPDGTAYIVMEMLKGETLNARIKALGGRMPMLTALALARQLASALSAAHAKGIIHRDLKPDNVMLVADPAVPGGERTKLLDFGIAKLKLEYQGGGEQVMTRAGVMMGTPLYMAPEQCRNARDVDDKADVYSLGVMLYRMLTGKPPFSAPGSGELMAMHIYMQPPPLGEANPSLPEPLVKLVHRMIAKQREERPSMSQVEPELARISEKAQRGTKQPPAEQPAHAPSQALLAENPPHINESVTVLSESSKRLASPSSLSQRLPRVAAFTTGLLVLFGGSFALYFLVQGAKDKPPPVPAKVEAASHGQKSAALPPKNEPPRAVHWHIESIPPGAQLYDSDTEAALGMTPFDRLQPPRPGLVRLELRLQGYQAARLAFDGSQDASPAAVKLEPEKSSSRKRDKKSK